MRAHGIDVSSYQGDINWEAVKASGRVGFAILRASRATPGGKLEKDARFERNRAACKRLGIPWGAYHYFRADVDGQAAFFVGTVGLDDPPPLGWWLDVEERDLTGERVMRGLAAIDARIGAKCGVYSSPSMMAKLQLAPDGRPLWIAHWNVDEPSVPDGWEWKVWQYDVLPEGSIPGILAAVDVDYFNGPLGEGIVDQVLALLGEARARIGEAVILLQG